MDRSGNFYGTTPNGGGFGGGTVFKLTPDGLYTTVHGFEGFEDGSYPAASLVADDAGNLYGTEVFEGGFDHGTIFRIAPNGTEKILHSFTGTDGDGPNSRLLVDPTGTLYGTTGLGGKHNAGTVFRLPPHGKLQVLHSFRGGAKDGARPRSGVISDAMSNLYTLTEEGGSADASTMVQITLPE